MRMSSVGPPKSSPEPQRAGLWSPGAGGSGVAARRQTAADRAAPDADARRRVRRCYTRSGYEI